MKKIIIKISLIIICLVAIIFVIRLFSGEDDWICVNGEWVRHGMPSEAIPTKTCTK